MNLADKPGRHWYAPKAVLYVLVALYLLAAGMVPVFIAIMAGVNNVNLLLLGHLLVVVALALFLGRKQPKAAFIVLILILPWQPVLSMPLASALGGAGIKVLVATKEIFTLALLGVLFLGYPEKLRWTLPDIMAALFVCVYTLYLLTSSAPLLARMVSFREGLMIAVFYFVGRLSRLTTRELRIFLYALVMVATLVALFGFIERFFFDEMMWSRIGAGEYAAAKFGWSDPESSLRYGLPKQWYTYIGSSQMGYTIVRRMVGPVGEPTSFSRFLSFAILTLLFIRGLFGKSPRDVTIRIVLIVLLGSASLLSFGRGGMVIVLGGALIGLFFKYRWVAVIFGMLIMLFLTQTALFDLQSGSNARHIGSLMKGVTIIQETPMGKGLGASGQLAVSFGGDVIEHESKVCESYFASLIAQMGVLGFGSYLAFMSILLWKLYKTMQAAKAGPSQHDAERARMALLAFAAISGIFLTSALANSSVAPISAGLPLIFAGAVVGLNQKHPVFPGRVNSEEERYRP